ncbi:MAG: hypothetical protein AAGE05_02385 [Pseudomonadota bacterium]
MTFTFSEPVREVTFSIFDVDFGTNQWRDYIRVTGTGPPVSGTASYVPLITTPFGTQNDNSPNQAGSSTVYLGPEPAASPAIPATDAIGNTGGSDNTQNFGNMTASFVQPVTSVTIRYANGPSQYSSGTAGNQWIGIHDITFCTLPDISIVKTSAPFDTSGPERFNIPDTDVVYTLTVTNNGESTAENTAIVDLLPADISFFNGDFNGAVAGTDNFEFVPGSSGLSLSVTNVEYSDNGGVTYTHPIASGYDSVVDAVRFSPQGIFAADSSFIIRFRARID